MVTKSQVIKTVSDLVSSTKETAEINQAGDAWLVKMSEKNHASVSLSFYGQTYEFETCWYAHVYNQDVNDAYRKLFSAYRSNQLPPSDLISRAFLKDDRDKWRFSTKFDSQTTVQSSCHEIADTFHKKILAWLLPINGLEKIVENAEQGLADAHGYQVAIAYALLGRVEKVDEVFSLSPSENFNKVFSNPLLSDGFFRQFSKSDVERAHQRRDSRWNEIYDLVKNLAMHSQKNT